MLGQLPEEKTSLPLQVEAVQDVMSGRKSRFLWTGFGFAVFMLIGVSACAALPYASAKPPHLDPQVAFNPSVPVSGLRQPPLTRRDAVVGTRQSAPDVFMKSQEDLEFDEWARQKKIASGVDPDEDFGTGRRAESTIYLVGGLIAVLVPVIAGTWAYNEGYLTPQ